MDTMQQIIAGYNIDYVVERSHKNAVKAYMERKKTVNQSKSITRTKRPKQKKYPPIEEAFKLPIFKSVTRKMLEENITNWKDINELRMNLEITLFRIDKLRLYYIQKSIMTNNFTELFSQLKSLVHEG